MIYKRLQRCFIALCIAACAAAAGADVVFLKDGSVVIGTITGTSEGAVRYLVAGEEIDFAIGSILRTDRELSALAELPLEAVLKDGSIIRGKIVDYDEELGYFIDIAFGTLTLPLSTVDELVDPVRRTAFEGASFQVRAGGGVYLPVLDDSGAFGQSWTAAAGASWALAFVRGLSGGIGVSRSAAAYDEEDIEYSFFAVRPELTYRYLGLRLRDSILNRLTPFASVSFGPAYVAVVNPDTVPDDYGELIAAAGLSAGFELRVAAGIALRMEGTFDAYLQEGTPFCTAGALLSVAYEH